MNDLQKMKASCYEFAKDLKTGNLKWYLSDCEHWAFGIEINENHLLIMLDDEEGGFFSLDCHLLSDLVILKSTTAREAALEALQLVKNEAQKLVDALEPKEGNTVEKLIKKIAKQIDVVIEPKEASKQITQIIAKMQEAKDNFPAMGFDEEFVRGFNKAFQMAIFITEQLSKPKP